MHRTADLRDGRAVLIQLTPKGRTLVHAIRNEKIQLIETHLKVLDRDKRTALHGVLDLLLVLEQDPGPPGSD